MGLVLVVGNENLKKMGYASVFSDGCVDCPIQYEGDAGSRESSDVSTQCLAQLDQSEKHVLITLPKFYYR